MFLTFTSYAAALCFFSACCKGGNRLGLVTRWRVVASGFLVDDSGLSGLCSKVNELQQLVAIGDINVLLAMALPFEHGNRIEL